MAISLIQSNDHCNQSFLETCANCIKKVMDRNKNSWTRKSWTE